MPDQKFIDNSKERTNQPMGHSPKSAKKRSCTSRWHAKNQVVITLKPTNTKLKIG